MDWYGRAWPLGVLFAAPLGCGAFVGLGDGSGDSGASSTTGSSTTDAPTSSSGGTSGTPGTSTTGAPGTTGGPSSTAGETSKGSSSGDGSSTTSAPEPACGNGVIEGAEDCDDDNLDDHDGCSARCAQERGFECVSEPSECGPASILVNGGFEDASGGDPIVNGNTFPVFFPGTALWFSDLGTFVAAEGGVSPLGGDRMLRFDATGAGASNFIACNMQQAIDMAPFSSLVQDGRVSLEASSFFNRVASAEDSQFRVRIIAWSGSPKGGFSQLALEEDEVFTDLDPMTWEEVDVTIQLPLETTFVVISIDAWENEANDTSPPEFAGHYADGADVRITVAPPE